MATRLCDENSVFAGCVQVLKDKAVGQQMVQDSLAVALLHWSDEVYSIVDAAIWPVCGTQLES